MIGVFRFAPCRGCVTGRIMWMILVARSAAGIVPAVTGRVSSERPKMHGDTDQAAAKWFSHWPEFLSEIEKRLDAGHREYGDGSFDRPTDDLVAELMEEALDLPGWAFVLWVRLRELSAKAQEVERRMMADDPGYCQHGDD